MTARGHERQRVKQFESEGASVKVAIWHLRRPQLRDRADDRVLETAANSGTTHIVTLQPSSAIEIALAEKVAAPQQQEIFTKPPARADKARFLDVLRRIGAEPPRLGDEWPED